MKLRDKVQKYLERIIAYQHLNAFIDVYSEEVLDKASQIDERIERGEKTGKLAGLVFAIKDNISIKGKRLTCASKILQNYLSLYDATVIEKIIQEDGLIIGKTNMDEFAMGSSNENSAFGIVKNPYEENHVPGGSSGGSAVAVAKKMCDVALGSDTGGSIRQPSAFCGTFGLKPTYGRVSRYGLVAFASSFDCIGAIANDTETIAKVMEVISGYDDKDSTSSQVPVQEFTKFLATDFQNFKVGLPKEFFDEGVEEDIINSILSCVDFLKRSDFEIIELSLPHIKYSIADYYILITAEASSNLSRYDGVKYGSKNENAKTIKDVYTKTRDEFFGKEVKRRIMLGTFVLSAGYYDAYYLKSQKVRRLIQKDFLEAFQKVDIIISPTTPTTAFKIGEKLDNPLSMYLSDIFTTSANLAGIPAMNIPIGFDSKGLPIGMQLMSNHFREDLLLQLSYYLEKNYLSNKLNEENV